MSGKKNIELIAGYLEKTLTPEEETEFLRRASTDKAFIKEFMKEAVLDDNLKELLGDD